MKSFCLKKCLKKIVSLSFSVSNRWIICWAERIWKSAGKKFSDFLSSNKKHAAPKVKKLGNQWKLKLKLFFIHSSCNKWKGTIALKSLCLCVWVRIPWSTGDRERQRDRDTWQNIHFRFVLVVVKKNPGFCLGWRAEFDLKLENFLFKNCLLSFKWNCTWGAISKVPAAWACRRRQSGCSGINEYLGALTFRRVATSLKPLCAVEVTKGFKNKLTRHGK